MKMLVVNEPLAEYKISGWKIQLNMKSFEDNITDINNGIIQFCPPTGLHFRIVADMPKIKLSALRGRISQITEKEIDDQISNLRTEWDRNI